MKKIKYFISLFVFIFIFSFDNVLAVGNIGPFSGLNISQSGNFIRHSGNSNLSLGYDVNINSTDPSVLDIKSYYYVSTAVDSNLIYADKGLSLLQCDMSFVPDNYYAVSYYFVSDSFSYYYHPSYSNSVNKLAIGTSVNMLTPNFTYDTVSNDVQYKLIENIGYLQSYTVIFKAPNIGTCLLSTFNSKPGGSSQNINYVGFNYEHLGTSPLTTGQISDALNNSFNDISSKLDNYTYETNKRLEELNKRQEEQNNTSKGIWQSLKDGIGSIGNWFSSLGESIIGGLSSLGDSIGSFFETLGNSIGGFFSDLWLNIKSLFIGEEVCSTVGEEVEREVAPKPFYTFNSSDFSCGFYYDKGVKKNANHMCSTEFISFSDSSLSSFYFKSSNVSGGLTFDFYDSNKNYLTSASVHYLDNYYNHNNDYGSFIEFNRVSINQFLSNVSYFTIYYNSYIGIFNFSEVYSSIDPTIETVIVDKEECTYEGGLFGIISDLTSSIGKWFKDLLSGLLEGIKALFVPSDDQLYEIIDDSSKLTENFGFVGESVNFFISIFTSLLGLVNANGCVELPEFSIGKTSLFDEYIFWEKQNVCLGDNVILSKNITTIRTITSIVLVCMFINFASSKFFSILSKNDYGTTTTYDNDGSATTYDWSRVNGDLTRYRR